MGNDKSPYAVDLLEAHAKALQEQRDALVAALTAIAATDDRDRPARIRSIARIALAKMQS
jgi:hypothetical protein